MCVFPEPEVTKTFIDQIPRASICCWCQSHREYQRRHIPRSPVSFLCVFPEAVVTKTCIDQIPRLVSVVGTKVIGDNRGICSPVLFFEYFPR